MGAHGKPVRSDALLQRRGAARRRAPLGPRARGAEGTRALRRTSRGRRRALVSGRDSTRATRLRDAMQNEQSTRLSRDEMGIECLRVLTSNAVRFMLLFTSRKSGGKNEICSVLNPHQTARGEGPGERSKRRPERRLESVAEFVRARPDWARGTPNWCARCCRGRTA